ncbi:MAG TPA: hypothetical protein VHV76_01785 [Mycobacteriales bacterium]|nr:hypothetical protein [Mycobacteriales bacterium]
MQRRPAIAIVALTATAGLLAGCGGGSSSGGSAPSSNNTSLSPAAELTSSITALGTAPTLTASLNIAATGSQLLSFVKTQDKGSKLTSKQAAEIAGLQVSFEVAAPSGKTLSSLSGLSNAGAVNIAIGEAGKSLLNIRLVKQVLYLQVDLKDVLNDIGQASAYRQITAASGQLPGFVGSLVKGKWVSLPLSTLKQLGSSLGAGTPPTSSASKSRQLIASLKSLLTKDVTVTRTSSGGTDQLALSGNLRVLAGDLTSTFASEIPGASAALGKANLSSVPNKSVTLQATVTSGSLSSVTFDLGQLAKSGNGSLPIELAFARTGAAITAPSGAVAVDLSTLGQLLGSFTQGLSSGG